MFAALAALAAQLLFDLVVNACSLEASFICDGLLQRTCAKAKCVVWQLPRATAWWHPHLKLCG
jgi:hypothetical protein